MEHTFVNKVADSGIITLDLETFFPKENETAIFDLKAFLFMELILKEKDFREQLKAFDWSVYSGKYVAVTCSVDAVIPVWAYMLVSVYLTPLAKWIVLSTPEDLAQKVLLHQIELLDVSGFIGQRVVVKGCGDLPIGEAAYLAVSGKLLPVVKSLMYGEPCSTVPIYKQKV